LAPLSSGRAGYKGGQLSTGKIILPGGLANRTWPPGESKSSFIQAYDIAADTWSIMSGTAMGNMAPANVSIGDSVYLIGGSKDGQVTNTNIYGTFHQVPPGDESAQLVSGAGTYTTNLGEGDVKVSYPSGSSSGMLLVSKLSTEPHPINRLVYSQYYDITSSAEFYRVHSDLTAELGSPYTYPPYMGVY